MSEHNEPGYTVCIPTLNPRRWADRMARALAVQRPTPNEILVIDSASDDRSLDAFAAIGATILPIKRADFDHGGTRSLALDVSHEPVVVYLTQDAIPTTPDTIAVLVAGLLDDDRNGMAFGRQLARPGARAATRVHRELLYPSASRVTTGNDIERLGVEASFASNSFAAYRRSALEAIGRFPAGIVSHEDRWAAGKLLQAGWNIAYVADATVEHSHDYKVGQQFRRYFDAGAFESTNEWFSAAFGQPHGRGKELVRVQFAAARNEEGAREAGRVVVHAAAALAGHQVGRLHERLPIAVQRRLTMNPSYFARRRPNHAEPRNKGA
jgi:rhamnosyltransferase